MTTTTVSRRTRAEWYAINTGGWWRKCRVPFRCDQVHHHGVRCENKVAQDALYFDTNAPKFPDATDARRFVKKRMCFSCSYEPLQQVVEEPAGQSVAATNCP
jgi:hypothetical protein